MSHKRVAQEITYEDATKGVADEIEDFLLEADAEDVEEEGEYLDQIFSEEEKNEFEFNSQNMGTPSEIGTMFDQTRTPDAPGSNDMTGPFMQLDTLPDVVNTTESAPIAPIEDQHAMDVLEYNEANDENIEFFDDEDFDFNTAEMTAAGQPLAQHSTQPPPGITNMMEGSTSDGASGNNQYNVETRTEGGTIGTTPDSTPMSKGYGQPSSLIEVNDDDLDEIFAEEEDILPDDDEILINEFDSLL